MSSRVISDVDIATATGNQITLSGPLTVTGAFGLTLGLTAATLLTLPTSGTLVATASSGTTGQTLQSNGSGSLPTWVTGGGGWSATPVSAIGSTLLNTSGTLSLATMAASTLLGNSTVSAAEPAPITLGSNMLLTVAGVLSMPGAINIQALGAAMNGVTDDNAAWVTAVADLAAQGYGAIIVPPGTTIVDPYTIAMITNSAIVGYGPGVSTIKSSRAIDTGGSLVRCNGASSASPIINVLFSNIGFNGYGGGPTNSAIFQVYYASNITWDNVYGTTSAGGFIDAAQLWDSRIKNMTLTYCGNNTSAGNAAIHIRNSAAASGLGFSADTSNQIFIDDVRIEPFQGTALRIEQGPGNTSPPNGFYVSRLKCENETMAAGFPFIYLGAGVTACSFRDVYLSADSFQYQYPYYPSDLIYNGGGGANLFDGINVHMNVAGLVNNAINHSASAGSDTYELINWTSGAIASTGAGFAVTANFATNVMTVTTTAGVIGPGGVLSNFTGVAANTTILYESAAGVYVLSSSPGTLGPLTGNVAMTNAPAPVWLAATASFATNVMTVTVANGTIANGAVLNFPGVTAGTTISSLGTGTGGTGTYNLSTTPGTIASEAGYISVSTFPITNGAVISVNGPVQPLIKGPILTAPVIATVSGLGQVVTAATATITSTATLVKCNATANNQTMTLPLAATCVGNDALSFVKTDSSGNTVSFAASGSDTLPSTTITTQNSFRSFKAYATGATAGWYLTVSTGS
jgi:hypothetical protein